MATREEIREGIANLAQMDSDTCDYLICKQFDDNCRLCRATAVIKYLHSQGVVIKVDEGSDDIKLPVLKEAWEGIVEDMKELGYTQWKPLIKE